MGEDFFQTGDIKLCLETYFGCCNWVKGYLYLMGSG